MSELMERWNKAWDGDIITFKRNPTDTAWIPADDRSRDLFKKYIGGYEIVDGRFDLACMILSNHGFCVETLC